MRDCGDGICGQEEVCVDKPICVDGDGDGFGDNCKLGPDCDDTNPDQRSFEICDDGLDNNCNGDVDDAAICGLCENGCQRFGFGPGAGDSARGWDLASREASQLQEDGDGALVLTIEKIDHQYIWIANSGQGTVSKFNTDTFVEEARYYSGPSGSGNDPSRTSVNTLGDVYVGNRAGRRITRISHLGADCDASRNGIAGVQTSQDLNGNGVIDWPTDRDGDMDVDADDFLMTPAAELEVLLWDGDGNGLPDDDCIVWTQGDTNTGASLRAVAAQDVPTPEGTVEEFLWTGGSNWSPPDKLYKLNGTNGEILLELGTSWDNYGFALDGSGNLWAAARSSNPNSIVRIDTNRCDTAACNDEVVCGDAMQASGDNCVIQQISVPGDNDPYGITVDLNQCIWLGGLNGDEDIMRYCPNAPWSDRWTTVNSPEFGQTHGIAADTRWAWAAARWGGVIRIDLNDPTRWERIDTQGRDAKGMAVDFDGKIWAIGQDGAEYATVITPGPTLGDANVQLDVATSIVRPYTYSDMTGQQLRLATVPRGWIRLPFEPCDNPESTRWKQLRWDADLPAGTQLTFRARTADSQAGLADAEWVQVAATRTDNSPIDLEPIFEQMSVLPKPWLELDIQFEAFPQAALLDRVPKLRFLEIARECSAIVI